MIGIIMTLNLGDISNYFIENLEYMFWIASGIVIVIVSDFIIERNKWNKMYQREYYENILRQNNENILRQNILLNAEKKQKQQLQEKIDQKKENFLNTSTIAFHYANENDIKDYYNDYFKEPTIEQIISENSRNVKGKIKGGAPTFIEAAIEGNDLTKWISTIKVPDISIPEMFRRYQRETIKNNQVALGLDLVEIDQTDLNDFEKFIIDFKSKFNMKIDESQIEQQRTSLKTKAIEKTMVRLENATGWVLVEGKFKIINQSDEFYKCIYEHPVNEYFAEKDTDITISISLKKDSLKSNIAGNYEQSIGKYIPIRVYGKVWQPVDRSLDVWELHITPLAIY